MTEILKQIREAELNLIKKLTEEWTRPRTIFAFMFYYTICYLIMKRIEIPQVLNTIVSTLMGFYFGQKVKTNGGVK